MTEPDEEAGEREPDSWWTLVWRWVTRASLDDDGAPSFAPPLVVAWSIFLMRFLSRPLPTEEAALNAAVQHSLYAVAFGFLLVVWAAAIKLGAAIFVPVAEAVASVLGRTVSIAASAVESARDRLRRTDYEPPDRRVPVGQRELALPADPTDDERG